MANNNKQAVEVKNTSLSAIDILIIIGTIVLGTLLCIFAPDTMLVIGKVLGCIAIVAMVVGTSIYALVYDK